MAEVGLETNPSLLADVPGGNFLGVVVDGLQNAGRADHLTLVPDLAEESITRYGHEADGRERVKKALSEAIRAARRKASQPVGQLQRVSLPRQTQDGLASSEQQAAFDERQRKVALEAIRELSPDVLRDLLGIVCISIKPVEPRDVHYTEGSSEIERVIDGQVGETEEELIEDIAASLIGRDLRQLRALASLLERQDREDGLDG